MKFQMVSQPPGFTPPLLEKGMYTTMGGQGGFGVAAKKDGWASNEEEKES